MTTFGKGSIMTRSHHVHVVIHAWEEGVHPHSLPLLCLHKRQTELVFSTAAATIGGGATQLLSASRPHADCFEESLSKTIFSKLSLANY